MVVTQLALSFRKASVFLSGLDWQGVCLKNAHSGPDTNDKKVNKAVCFRNGITSLGYSSVPFTYLFSPVLFGQCSLESACLKLSDTNMFLGKSAHVVTYLSLQ